MLSITQSPSQNITSNFKVFEKKVQSVTSQLQDMSLKVEEISVAVVPEQAFSSLVPPSPPNFNFATRKSLVEDWTLITQVSQKNLFTASK